MNLNLPRPADLMFTFHPGGILSEAISFVTKCKISHVQMIVDTGVDGNLKVISAEAQGLTEKWLINGKFDIPWYCILTYNNISQAQRLEIVAWMTKKQKERTPYDVWGLASFLVNIDLNNEKKSFCSEVNYQAYENSGILLLDGIDHAFVSPRDLWICPLLDTLDGSRKEIR